MLTCLADQDGGQDLADPEPSSSQVSYDHLLLSDSLVAMDLNADVPLIPEFDESYIDILTSPEFDESDIDMLTSLEPYETDVDVDLDSEPYDTDVEVELDSELVETDCEYTASVERFADPEKWFSKLEDMRIQVIARSGVKFYLKGPSLLFTEQQNHTTNHHASSDLGIDQESMLLEGVNQIKVILEGALTNLHAMRDAGYCTDSINFLELDPGRPSVVQFIHLPCSNITSFVEDLHIAFTYNDSDAIIKTCSKFLHSLGSAMEGAWGRYTSTTSDAFDQSLQFGPTRLARLAAQLLDLALLSYSGAHIEPLQEQYLSSESQQIYITPHIILRQMNLQCLDAYLNRPAWVFTVSDDSDTQEHSTGLYLSTTITDFSAIWGPVWAVFSPENPDIIFRYNVGLGSILGWKRAPEEPETLDDEKFCHWIPASDDIPPELVVKSELQGSRLLIGGKLRLNSSCTLDHSAFTVEMEDWNRLHPLPLRWRQWYTDGRTVNASLGGLGVTIGGSESYKLRHKSYREDLAASLANNEFDGCIAILQHRYVVEISACTGLSRRRNVAYALACSGLKNYLKSADLVWENSEWESTYFETLLNGSTQEFKRCLNQEGLGAAMKQALKKSMLNVLLKTGPEASKELIALWMPSEEQSPQAVSFPLLDYSWVGLLQEGSLGFNMAIVNDICLEMPSKSPHRSLTCVQADQGPSRYTLLETHLLVNNELRKSEKLPEGLTPVRLEAGSCYDERWSLRKLKPGKTFDLGEQGTLKVLKIFVSSQTVESRLVVSWNDLTPSRAREVYQVIRQTVGMTTRPMCHREYLISRKGVRTAPILIHVVSSPSYVH